MSKRNKRQTDPPITGTSSSSTQTVLIGSPDDNNDGDNTSQPKTNDNSAEVISDSEDDKPNSSNSKPKIQVYRGLNDKISVENWIKRFEMIAQFNRWSDKTKIVMLGNYLEDDAMNWYIENCLESDDYVNIKAKIQSRFGLETVEPIIEFVNVKYDVKTGVKAFFETKRRFGIAAKLTEKQMIPLMIQSLHPKMIESFIAVKPKSFAEFYSIAMTAESSFKRFINRNTDSQSIRPKPKLDQGDKPKRKPPSPCRICENLGHKNRYHWANECRNRGKPPQPQTYARTTNTINANVNSDSLPENDINQIEV